MSKATEVQSLTPEQLHILQHSLGLDQWGKGTQYRNHFATSPGTTDYPFCQQLVEMGLMKNWGTRDWLGEMTCFTVTTEGIQAVKRLSPKKPKRVRLSKNAPLTTE